MPRLSLINALRGPVPPDGYRYVDPESGFLSHSFDYTDWVDKERNHLKANGKEVPHDLNDQMEEQLCKTLPPGWCNYDDPHRNRPLMQIEWPDVLRASETFARWVAGGMELVDQQEAERRATICTRCYFNVQMGGCSACQAAIQRLSVNLTSKHDSYLKSCAVCKCYLKAKVHFPLKALDTGENKLQEMYPEFCWLKKGGPNYK